jgi:hypothetical protein
MVRDDVFEKIEPEQRNLGQDAALVWNAGRENVVEGRNTVGGHEEKVIGIEVVHVADFAAGVEL